MPTLEQSEYERFSYEESGLVLPLDEAIKKAIDLRKSDSTHFYRVERVEPSGDDFRVDKISTSVVYAEFLARMVSSLGKFTRVYRRI